MATHNFTLVLDAPSLQPDDLDRLFEAGCDDASFGERLGAVVAEFDREGPTFAAALVRGISDVEAALPAVNVVRVEPDDLVSAATIAERIGRTRESVRKLASGERGPGGFPTPVTWLDGSSKIWHWAEVAEWLETSLGETPALGGAPHYVAALNAALETRRKLKEISIEDDLAFGDEEIAILPALVSDTAVQVQRELASRSS